VNRASWGCPNPGYVDVILPADQTRRYIDKREMAMVPGIGI